jgi:Predicted oxidoreductases (related to aryl-alcohol dehydrogenases)
MSYYPANNRYENSVGYNFCGKSGLKLPVLSLGLWYNFGDVDSSEEALKMLCYAFDNGITHFDLANNYGTPYGSAETNFGKILKTHFAGYRDEMIISTKAGHEMWTGPYGNGGSRKYLLSSLDQSLRRMQLDYVDIFYSHRYDPETPLEETMGALSDAVRQGKALYVGISKYPKDKAEEAIKILKNNGTPCLIYQARYSILTPEVETEIFPLAQEKGLGVITFSPLAQGLLSNKYLSGIPENSRAAKAYGFFDQKQITAKKIDKINQLNKIATQRGQSLAQMALAWCLRKKEVNSVIIGTSSVAQLKENIQALNNLTFSEEELNLIKN